MDTENANSTLLLYTSRYGAAKEYAGRLAGMRDCDVAEAKNAKLTQLRAYDTILWIGGVYEEKIQGLETLRRYAGKLKDQGIAVLAVGAAPEEAAPQLSGDLAEIPLFYARGRWDPQHFDWKDKMLVQVLKAALSRKPDAAPAWMQQLLSQDEAQDFMDDCYLDPVLDFISGR